MVLALFFLLFLRLSAQIGANPDECREQSCGPHGPAIRFPFRLKDQPNHCGYPGFEISCTEKKQTILELPYSVKFTVDKINYRSREIAVHDSDFCLQRQFQNLILSASPFQFKFDSSSFSTWIEDYTFFSCSSINTEDHQLMSIPCRLLDRNPVYAVMSDWGLDGLDLSSCHKLFNVSLPNGLFDGKDRFSFTWSESICGSCENASEKCRLKSNSKGPQTECIPKRVKGLKEKVVVSGVIVGCFVLVCVVILTYLVHRSHKSKQEHLVRIEKFLEDYKAFRPSRYSYKDIKKLTSNFKDKLGQGGYGIVYKGKLSDEVFVAVKILHESKGNGDEFINEVGTIGRIHHVNVVRLLGFCADGDKRALIYEFLQNESLDKFIFSSSMKNNSLGWEKLQDIAIGLAKGIEYLHQGCDQRILHFDIKPHNVLLDENFIPKLSDFGLAKLYSKDQSIVSMTVARGTMGYIAPEVLSRNFGNASYKSDVYSFGMLLLEMVGGRKNIDVARETNEVYFPEWVYNQLDQGRGVDIQIEEDGDIKIAKKLTLVGLWCIQWYPIDRPSMKVVVQMLEREGDNLTIPPNPFMSLDPSGGNIRRRRRSLQQELTIISE